MIKIWLPSLFLALSILPAFAQQRSEVLGKEESTKQVALISPMLHETSQTVSDMIKPHDQAFAAAGFAYLAAYATDMISTKYLIDRCASCVESQTLGLSGSRSVRAIAAVNGLQTVSNLIIAHAWKKHAPKQIRWLWPLPLVAVSYLHIRATYGNFRLP